MKKKILAVCLVVICLSLAARGTLSYFTAKSIAHNVITTGSVKIELREKFPAGGVQGALPGDTIPKKVWIKNTGSAAAWVRVSVELSAVSPAGEKLPVDLPKGALLSFDLLPGWIQGNDGFYYYQFPLTSAQETSNLMEQVLISSQINHLYENSTLQMDITAYGVQADNNGHTVWEADGWPAA